MRRACIRNLGFTLLVGTTASVHQADAGDCPQSTGPDIVIAGLSSIVRFGGVDGVSGYAIGTDACNVGDTPADWNAHTPAHPVIAQHMYRLRDGRFEQIGMSWVKHGFQAMTGSTCCVCQPPGSNQLLGVGCSDLYSAAWNGDQDGFLGIGGLGQRSEINASTGEFPFPYATLGMDGDAIYKRLQLRNDDLDPSLNPGARYFGEGHYVTADDSAAGNMDNNVSYREATVDFFMDGGWVMGFAGLTQREQPALMVWAMMDADVVVNSVDVPGDGRFMLGSRCTENPSGTWHYEYALYNMNSHRSARSFAVPAPPGVTVTNPGFSDVDYHSGEIYDAADWPPLLATPTISWTTQVFETNPNANALRWGTLYNFWFDADAPPEMAESDITLFRPGTPASVPIGACVPAGAPVIPGDSDGDGDVDLFDYAAYPDCVSGPGVPSAPGCEIFDFDADGDVDLPDFGGLLLAFDGG